MSEKKSEQKREIKIADNIPGAEYAVSDILTTW